MIFKYIFKKFLNIMGNLYSYFNSSNNENSNDEFMENEIFYNKVKNYKHKIIRVK